MPKDWSAELKHVSFKCGVCQGAFDAPPDLVEDDPETPHHPYKYFGHCPWCRAQNQPQVSWERALLKAHQASTGPKTPEGLAASRSNLAGHPTPEEALRTRFNAMKHGLNARTATYFPSRPDKYAFCQRCDVDRLWCADQPACVKQTEIFMLHHAAFEQRDPKLLSKLHGDLQAALTATLQMCIQEVLGTGVIIKAPKVELSRDGVPVTLTYLDANGDKQIIYDYHANPAFKPIEALISRLGLSMTDLGMTVRAADADEDENLGNLQQQAKSVEGMDDFAQRMLKATENAAAMIVQAAAATRKDPVLVEYQAQGGDQ